MIKKYKNNIIYLIIGIITCLCITNIIRYIDINKEQDKHDLNNDGIVDTLDLLELQKHIIKDRENENNN